MDLSMIIRVAFRALVRNKMRAILTMLGIIIGVGAVIAMVSIGQGAQASVQAQIESIGTNLLFVSAGAQNVGGVRSGTGDTGTNTLTVTCSLTGNPNNLASGTANSFGPGTVNLSNGSGSTLSASLNSGVTSPDGTVSGISGGSTGFTGTVNSLPAKVQASYNVTTTSSTKSGTYTGTTTYTWSTI